jgi:enamine deaminase RidA (YjgF/YER057c/UK114 family)
MSERRWVASAAPWESEFGYCRAIRVGAHVQVSGTAPVMPDGAPPPAGAYEQTKRCFEIIAAALAEAGAGLEHVVRTRIYSVRREHFADIARAHVETFGEIRPASTCIVATLLDPRWTVEVEADAIVD